MTNFLLGVKGFFEHLFSVMFNIYFWIIGILVFCIGYPAPILTMCFALFIFDIFTRWYAIFINAGGILNAFFTGKFSSRGLWTGFMTKLIGYFVILTISHFASATPEISYIGNNIASFLYIWLFIYEGISILENLRDAHFQAIEPILNRLKKEQNKLFGIGNKKNKRDDKN